jgi:hypothetical protein
MINNLLIKLLELRRNLDTLKDSFYGDSYTNNIAKINVLEGLIDDLIDTEVYKIEESNKEI